MRLGSEIFGIALVLLIVVALVRFFLERARQKKLDATGTVLYATFLSSEPVKMFGRPQADFLKVRMRVQEPGAAEPREVSMSTRVPVGQTLQPGMKIPVVLDPKNPKRIYPASETAAKRAVMTGSRVERRQMSSQIRTGRSGPQQPGGYMPPNVRPGKRVR